MPWKTNKTGVKTYSVSIYAKEELPTWGEVYNDWYKAGMPMYNRNDDHEIDPYWRIPKLKLLVTLVCNQFNKMLLEEDGLKNDLLSIINKRVLTDDCIATGIRFMCEVHPTPNTIPLLDTAPVIYTIPLPTKKTNPFIIPSNAMRLNVTCINDDLGVIPLIYISRAGIADVNYVTQPINPYNDTLQEEYYIDDMKSCYKVIIDRMMKPFIYYFGGEDLQSRPKIEKNSLYGKMVDDGGLLGAKCIE